MEPWSLTARRPRPALIDALRRHASPTRARSRVQHADRTNAGVCREWRCKYEGDKVTSASLEAIAGVVDEYMSKIKAIDKSTTVNRLVCGSCLDFKLMITNDLDAYGPWSETDHAPEAEFIAKLKAIDGVSQVETQTITNMVL